MKITGGCVVFHGVRMEGLKTLSQDVG